MFNLVKYYTLSNHENCMLMFNNVRLSFDIDIITNIDIKCDIPLSGGVSGIKGVVSNEGIFAVYLQ